VIDDTILAKLWEERCQSLNCDWIFDISDNFLNWSFSVFEAFQILPPNSAWLFSAKHQKLAWKLKILCKLYAKGVNKLRHFLSSLPSLFMIGYPQNFLISQLKGVTRNVYLRDILDPLQKAFSSTDLGRERGHWFSYTILAFIIPFAISISSNVFPCINTQRRCCGWSGDQTVHNFGENSFSLLRLAQINELC
jgi:hypothetical protein